MSQNDLLLVVYDSSNACAECYCSTQEIDIFSIDDENSRTHEQTITVEDFNDFVQEKRDDDGWIEFIIDDSKIPFGKLIKALAKVWEPIPGDVIVNLKMIFPTPTRQYEVECEVHDFIYIVKCHENTWNIKETKCLTQEKYGVTHC